MGCMSASLDKPFEPFKAAQAAAGGNSGTADKPLFEVELPSGAFISVPTEEEATHLGNKVAQYREQFNLDNVADLGEVDRCLTLELLSHRYQTWLARRCDYDAKTIDENALQQRCKEMSNELRQIKKTLGIDKVSRERQTGRGSAYQRVTDILDRARRFGLMRNAQSAKATELAMELISMMTARSNCKNDKQKRMLRVTDEDIFEWIETVFTPEFMEIDEAYRREDQRMWILQTQ